MPYAGAAAVVSEYGDALQGKVIIDITNPVSPDLQGFVTPEGSSGAQEIAKAAPAGAQQPGPAADRIRADVTFLADDMFEGRGTGTEGYELAARFVASRESAIVSADHAS